jgi:BirA family biotin operon repressor/biotin-[acetyl-CoA-carboxylase] ligase
MLKPLYIKSFKHFRSIDSSNIFAEKWMAEQAPEEISLVLTDYQTQGKGLGSNVWKSKMCKNLLLSILVYPRFLAPDEQFMLNKIISLAVCNCVKYFIEEPDVTIKWPNDIYVEKRKIAGILSKNTIVGNSIQSSIIGVGLNVNQVVFDQNIPNPVSLKQVKGKSLVRRKVLQKLLEYFTHYYDLLKKNQMELIDQEYLALLLNYNFRAKYRSGGQEFLGTITGVSKYGQLQMRSEGRPLQFEMKEVEFLFE